MILGIVIGATWLLALTLTIYEARFAGEPTFGAKPDKPESASIADWRQTWYDKAHADIQWAKERGWSSLQAVVLLEAALVAAESGSLLTAASNELLVAVAAVAGALSMIYLVDLHRFAKKVRVIADRILDEIPEREYYLGKPRARDRHHVFYLGVKLAVIAASTTLAAIALA